VRDNLVAASANHGLLDGGSMPSMCDLRPVLSPKFPIAVDDIFKDELEKVSKAQVDEYMQRASKFALLPESTAGTSDTGYCEYICEGYAPSTFQCYDKKSGQLKGLTEALWAAAILPIIAITGK
jgi:hypothetical protein